MLPAIAWSMSVSLGLGFFSSKAVADMICPDWQYPHCTTSRSTHAFCTAFAARDDKPSIVVMVRLATAETGAEHERNGHAEHGQTEHSDQRHANQRVDDKSGIFEAVLWHGRFSLSEPFKTAAGL